MTTELPAGTHQVRAVYLGDADYAQVTSAPISHLTKGVLEQLQDLSAMIDAFNIGNKGNKFDNTIRNITKHYDKGQPKQSCKELGDFVKKANQSVGKSLTAGQAAALRDCRDPDRDAARLLARSSRRTTEGALATGPSLVLRLARRPGRHRGKLNP